MLYVAIGSSPRVRGTRAAAAKVGRRSRFIPACAGNSGRRTSRSPRSPVHPRVCGELPRDGGWLAAQSRFIPACAGNSWGGSFDPATANGSSPRVRGTHGRDVAFARRHRFIPACAGNSSLISLSCDSGSVHPRVCGELGELVAPPVPRRRFIPACAGNSWGGSFDPATANGSSPRVRGTHGRDVAFARRHRFIPACAGNSSLISLSCDSGSVHPRVCGELRIILETPAHAFGSSPRVRGTRPAMRRVRPWRRFIPACAGNSRYSASARATSTVHPRVCGELHPGRGRNGCQDRFIPACAGNSLCATSFPSEIAVHPRVCGELLRAFQARLRWSRFIPACAGNSSTPTTRTTTPPVHPRVCGELPNGVRPVGHVSRFIPACAGNSDAPNIDFAAKPVHPRVCGELIGRPIAPCPRSGSSPRVRGTPTTEEAKLKSDRFIPACAGNSSRALTSSVRSFGSSLRVRGTPTTNCARASSNPVHPRVCGELGFAAPRGAGRPRFIPACAGNSICALPRLVWRTVHPRVCGELGKIRDHLTLSPGSSPRVRGTPPVSQRPLRRRRFIPACAGNSSTPTPSCAAESVHPRVCGELELATGSGSAVTGSSPRVRGTPHH